MRGLLEELDEIEAAGEAEYGDQNLEEVGEGKEIDPGKMKEAAEKINQKLRKDPKEKTLKRVKQSLEKVIIHRHEKYTTQENLDSDFMSS